MKMNNTVKGFLISLSMLTLAACSSTDDATTSGTTGSDDGSVITSPMDNQGGLSEQEQLQQKLREASTVFFKYDNSEISSEYEEVLVAHANFLSSMPNTRVTIEGYADERGTPEYNIALGERRAEAVSKYLQALGVQASQISIVSYGEEKPLVMGQSESAYSQNRRAVVVY